MPIVRLTAFFRDDDGHGWSEQHDQDGGPGTPTLAGILSQFDSFNKQFRRPLLAADGYYIGCRASYKTANGQTAASNILNDPPLIGQQTSGGTPTYMNQASNAVKLRMQNAANTANSDVYLRGVWDAVFNGGVIDFTSAQGAAWKVLMTAYVDQLRGLVYGWQGIDPALTSRGAVTGYVQNEIGTVTLTIAVGNAIPLPAVGTKINVNFARINEGRSSLNRSLVCVVASPTTLTTVRQIAVSEFLSNGTYIAPVKGFIPYDHFGYVKAANRKTGRPFGVAPGRLPARTLH